jgi:hypothetical protein
MERPSELYLIGLHDLKLACGASTRSPTYGKVEKKRDHIYLQASASRSLALRALDAKGKQAHTHLG